MIWNELLKTEKEKPYFKKLTRFLDAEDNSGYQIFPERKNIFRALDATPLDQVKVVILGQDPYHKKGQAIGLSFAVPNSLKSNPPSLQNIFKEIQSDLKTSKNTQQSDLSGWTQQGVLLLNTVLTVREGQADSHRSQGWEIFTDFVIEQLSARKKPIVFLLWGAAAQKKRALIQNHHFILEAPHPSPLSAYRGFLGCKHFSKTNTILKKNGQTPIEWQSVS